METPNLELTHLRRIERDLTRFGEGLTEREFWWLVQHMLIGLAEADPPGLTAS